MVHVPSMDQEICMDSWNPFVDTITHALKRAHVFKVTQGGFPKILFDFSIDSRSLASITAFYSDSHKDILELGRVYSPDV